MPTSVETGVCVVPCLFPAHLLTCTQITHTQLTHTHLSQGFTHLESSIQTNHHVLIHSDSTHAQALIYFYCDCIKGSFSTIWARYQVKISESLLQHGELEESHLLHAQKMNRERTQAWWCNSCLPYHLTSLRKYSEGYFVPWLASSSLRNSLLLMTLRHLSS